MLARARARCPLVALLLLVGCFDPAGSSSETDATETDAATMGTTSPTSEPSTSAGPTSSPTGGTTGATDPTDPTDPTTSVDSTGTVANCGDGQTDAGEDCDDGNTVSGDGCSAACLDETVFCDPGLAGALAGNLLGRMVADGGYLYVVTPWASNTHPSLRIFDVSNPGLITPEGSFEMDENNYPSHRTNGIVKSGDHVWIGGNEPELISVNVSDPSSPVLAHQGSPNQTEGHLALSGDFLFASRSVSETVRVYDISNPASAMTVGSIGNPGDVYYNVGLGGDHAFISTYNNRVDVVDVSVPAAGQVVGMYTHSEAWASSTDVRKIVGNDDTVAFAVVGQGVHILDTSLPTAPDHAATLSEGADDLALLGDFLYVPFVDGLRVYDIADPENPELAAAFVELQAYSTSVTLDDTYAYLVTENGIRVIAGLPGLCTATCGNNHVEYPEDCDDGNLDDGDDCPSTC